LSNNSKPATANDEELKLSMDMKATDQLQDEDDDKKEMGIKPFTYRLQQLLHPPHSGLRRGK